MADSSGFGFWSNLVSIGTDMTGGIMSAILTKQQNEKQRNWSSAEAAKQRAFAHQERVGVQDWAREMWNLNNAYNTPSEQMQRMMAAGINPNSAAGLVGSGASSAPPASISPAAGASASMPAQFNEQEAIPSMLNATANYKAQLAQADLAKAMAAKTQEETKGIVIDNNYKPFEKEANIGLARQKIDLMEKQGELTHEQAVQTREMLDVLKKKTIAETQNLFNNAAYIAQRKDNLLSEKNFIEEQIKTEYSKRKQMDAAAYEAYMSGLEHESAIEVNGKRVTLEAAEARLKIIEGNIRKSDNVWRNVLRSANIDPDSHGASRLIDMGAEGLKGLKLRVRSLMNGDDIQLNSYSWDDMPIPKDIEDALRDSE